MRWLVRNKQALNGKIARGIAQLDRGECVAPGVARARRTERREALGQDK